MLSSLQAEIYVFSLIEWHLSSLEISSYHVLLDLD